MDSGIIEIFRLQLNKREVTMSLKRVILVSKRDSKEIHLKNRKNGVLERGISSWIWD